MYFLPFILLNKVNQGWEKNISLDFVFLNEFRGSLGW
jgi:hypothetical protein